MWYWCFSMLKRIENNKSLYAHPLPSFVISLFCLVYVRSSFIGNDGCTFKPHSGEKKQRALCLSFHPLSTRIVLVNCWASLFVPGVSAHGSRAEGSGPRLLDMCCGLGCEAGPQSSKTGHTPHSSLLLMLDVLSKSLSHHPSEQLLFLFLPFPVGPHSEKEKACFTEKAPV